MTIYRLYSHNGDRAGFWVQHRSWSNMCAQIQTIAGQTHGRLPGASPLYDNAEVLVRAFDVRSGRPVTLGPRLDAPQDQKYTRIAEPHWFCEEKAASVPSMARIA